MTYETTLAQIEAQQFYQSGWLKLRRHLGKDYPMDKPVSLLTILESNGLDDALWCCRAVEGHDREFRLFAVWCARQVQHLMTDPCSINAIDTAERFANGEATPEEMDAAWDATEAAARAAAEAAAMDAAWDATKVAAWAVARAAAWAVARAAARAARVAAWAAGVAAWAARAAAESATWATEWDSAMAGADDAQEAEFRRMIAEGY